jgi:hypothetical protein
VAPSASSPERLRGFGPVTAVEAAGADVGTLRDQAAAVLRANDEGGYTVPSRLTYE